jgi:ABC-2 type transport system ATP-binding protein
LSTAIEATGLGKRFGQHVAVRDVDLAVPTGAVYGFLGPNGAGKTTTIRMALGLLRPTSGTVRVFGADVRRERQKSAAMTGSMVEEPALYLRLTGRENLEISRALLGCARSEVDRALEVVGLTGAAGRLAGTYSQGMRQRLGLARALLGGPKLLMLDEPTNGLDPDGIREIRNLIKALPERGDVTVFVSSHLLAEVEQMATHVGLMSRGRLVLQGTLADLKRATSSVAQVRVDDPAAAAERLAGLEVTPLGVDGLTIVVPDGRAGPAFLAEVNTRLVAGGIGVFGLALPTLSLEDIYVRATGMEEEARS